MKRPPPLAVGDIIRIDGETARLVDVGSRTCMVKFITTSGYQEFSTGDLARLVAVDRIGDPALVNALDEPARERVMHMHRHVVELLTGFTPDAPEGGSPNPLYGPGVPMGQRVESKVKELSTHGHPISVATLWRKVKAYREKGIAGLIDGRANASRIVTGRTDPRVVELVEKYVDAQTMRSTRTKTAAIAEIRRQATAEGLTLPSMSTMNRLLRTVDANRGTFGLASTRRTKANQPRRAFRSVTAHTPGAIIEIDSTPLDAYVMYPDGSTGRPELTIGIDVATRSIVAAYLSPLATKDIDAAMLLVRILTPLAQQPAWQDGWALDVLPDDMFPDRAEVMQHIRKRAVVTPQTVTVDRGRVYQSETFQSACQTLGISVTNAAPYSPTNKPHVERAFGVTNSLFTQYLGSYTGSDVARRGKDPAAEAYWTFDQMQSLLDLWVTIDYQNRPHSGLAHPALRGMDLTPNEALEAFQGVAPTVPIVLTRDDHIGLLNVTYRTINSYGINFNGLIYQSDELAPLRGRKSGIASAGQKWETRFDPTDCKTLYVRHTQDEGQWIEARWNGAGDMAGPLAINLLNAAVAAAKKRHSKQARDLHPGEVVEQIRRIETKPQDRTERSATRQAARATGHIKETPDLPATEVADEVVPSKRSPMTRADEDF